jgi:hypothetical protein
MGLCDQANEPRAGVAGASPRPSGRRGPETASLRLALVTTPRSGVTWLRHLLATAYAVPELAAHSPAELDWAALPASCVLSVHWHRTPAFEGLLREHGFRVVTVARHPLDVLISILHFALYDTSPLRWLEGEGGDEGPICGAMPCSTPFLEYATGRRAKALLSVGRQWWEAPGCYRVRYESLVADPHGELRRAVDSFGVASARPLAEAVAENTIPRLRQRTRCGHHFWKGEPGLWKGLLPATEARLIAAAQPDSFAAFGYSCDPDPGLDRRRADASWVALTRPELAEKVDQTRRVKSELAAAQGRLGATLTELDAARSESAAARAELAWRQTELAATRTELAWRQTEQAAAQGELARCQTELGAAQGELAAARAALVAAQEALARVEDLGPRTLRLAKAIRRWSLRYPRISSAIKRFVRSA